MSDRCRAALVVNWDRAKDARCRRARAREVRNAPDDLRLPIADCRLKRTRTTDFQSQIGNRKSAMARGGVMSTDKDLLSVQQPRDLVDAAHKAQLEIVRCDQAKIDRICEAMAKAALREAARLGAMAVEET